jgi:FkbM family methyltransferase
MIKNQIRLLIKTIISFFIQILQKFSLGRYIIDQILNASMENVVEVRYKQHQLKFTAPDTLNYFRADTFSIKEPETLEWIDRMPSDSVVWDIGANIGLYSCYIAKTKGCSVYAFEPSVFNLELLARNIFLNGLVDKIFIMPFPLSDCLCFNKLNMASVDRGGALSSFGQSFGHNGKSIKKVFEFNTIGLSMDDALKALKLPQPDYIKMDVDGIEHLILEGGSDVLKEVKEVLVEVNDDFKQQATSVKRLLEKSGFLLKEKRHSIKIRLFW